jgi:sec-independent protein translocase protein TatA
MDPSPVFTLAFGLPGGFEYIVILIIALLIFGPKLPSIMRGLGGSIKEFKKGVDEGPAKDAAKDPVKDVPANPDAKSH